MNPMPIRCPVCQGDLFVSRLHCPNCETTLEGSFSPGGSRLQDAFTSEQLHSLLPFSRLSQEQLYFVLTFMRCEGRFNRMEEELNLSYPTLRTRLDEILITMGFLPIPEQVPLPAAGPSVEERQQVLDLLQSGQIDVAEAQRRLRGEAN